MIKAAFFLVIYKASASSKNIKLELKEIIFYVRKGNSFKRLIDIQKVYS